MKHLLNGVTIAAALAIATPVWAQAPAGAPAPAPAAPAAAPAKPMAKPMAKKQVHHRPARHMAKGGKMRKMTAGDKMTEQLNREELARIQGGNMAAPPPPPAPPAATAVQGPKPSGGARR